MKRIVLTLSLLVLFTGLCFSGGYSQVNREERLKAPQLTVKPINRDEKCQIGGPNDKYTVLLFWTTWCPHCAVAMEDMNNYFRQYKDKVRFCGIAVGEDPVKVASYIASRGIKFPVVVDERGEIGYIYGIMGVPTIFVIDREGYVVDYGYVLPRIIRRLMSFLEQEEEQGGRHDGRSDQG